jgi:Rrf2 family protein
MKISAKARYGLASALSMAVKYDSRECITLISLAEELKISKIYLEQVFALLKRGGVVTSTKGSQGGYSLSRPPKEIPVYDILSSIETSLYEKTDDTVAESDESIEKAMRETVFDALDEAIKNTLNGISLEDVRLTAEKYKNDSDYMYYL